MELAWPGGATLNIAAFCLLQLLYFAVYTLPAAQLAVYCQSPLQSCPHRAPLFPPAARSLPARSWAGLASWAALGKLLPTLASCAAFVLTMEHITHPLGLPAVMVAINLAFHGTLLVGGGGVGLWVHNLWVGGWVVGPQLVAGWVGWAGGWVDWWVCRWEVPGVAGPCSLSHLVACRERPPILVPLYH